MEPLLCYDRPNELLLGGIFMIPVIIIGLFIFLIILGLTIFTINKGYAFKHTIDEIPVQEDKKNA